MGSHIVQIVHPSVSKAWLKRRDRTAGPALRHARGLGLLDGVAAIGFAAGLAFGADAIANHRDPLIFCACLAGVLAAMLLRALLAYASARTGAKAAAGAKAELRADLARSVFGGPRRSAGEATTALVEGVEAMDGYFARFLPTRMAATALPLLMIAVAAIASPICAAIMLATLIPFIAAMILAGTAAAAEARAQFQALERLSGLFLDRVRALPVVLAFEAEGTTTAALSRSASALAERTLKVLRVAFLSSAALEFFAALSVALVAVYCGFNLLGLLPFPVPEQLDLPRALFVLALAPELYLPLRRLAAAYHDKQLGQAAAERLAGVLDGPSAPEPSSAAIEAAPAIRFEGAAVRHPEGPLIGPVSFTAPAGAVTAILGPSGSGKTSLLSLLVGAAPLADGEVFVGEHPISKVRSVARSVAWAGQTPALAPGSIAYNIGLGRTDAPPGEVAQAARLAGLEPALRQRTDGLATELDERGSSRLASGIFALLIALIILSVGLVIIDSYDPERHEWVQDATSVLRPLEYVCSVVFTLEVSAALVSL